MKKAPAIIINLMSKPDPKNTLKIKGRTKLVVIPMFNLFLVIIGKIGDTISRIEHSIKPELQLLAINTKKI